jgi:hypothetical protein
MLDCSNLNSENYSKLFINDSQIIVHESSHANEFTNRLKENQRLRIVDLAKLFNYGLTKMKRIIKENGMKKWPSRTLRSIDLIDSCLLNEQEMKTLRILQRFDIFENKGVLPDILKIKLKKLISTCQRNSR